uniref:glucuronosyltransferase n=1 Tax=Angiostrongylus cantonensis TaxID=6313 RepID=A0A0K0CXY4_ANGCA
MAECLKISVVLRDNATMDRLINERFDAGIAEELLKTCTFIPILTSEVRNFELHYEIQKLGLNHIIGASAKLWHCHNISVKEDDYVNKMNYLLLNSDEFLEFARPISAKVVHIGGIALPEPSPLPEELQKIMDQSYRSGVVYISFGSIASTIEMPRHFRRAIFSVARAFPMYSFIWKVDGDDAIESVSNLYTFTWVPQRSLLGDTLSL